MGRYWQKNVLESEQESSKLHRLLPGLKTLSTYSPSKLGVDFIAGLTVTAYLIPQVMAYAELAHVPAATGLMAIIPCFILYFFLGSSRILSVGPESTTALMAGASVGVLSGGDPSKAAALASALAIIVGLWCLAAKFLRLGALAELLSQPILVGYMAGVALLMVASQLGKLTGTHVTGDRLHQQVMSFIDEAPSVSLVTALIGVLTLVLLITLDKLVPKAPAALIAVVVSAIAVSVGNLEEHGVKTVGMIPSALPVPAIPAVSLSDIQSMLLPAVGVALIAYSSNVLTARAFSERGEKVNPDRELVALGGVSIASGIFGGFPVSSSSSRTAISKTAGAFSQVHSLVAAGLVFLVLLFASDLLASFPMTALGAVVVYAAIKLINVKEFKRLLRFRTSEAVLSVVTCVATLTFGILPGIAIAVAVSVGELLLRVSRPHDSVLGHVPGMAGMHDKDDYPHAQTIPGLVVYRYDSPLFFANAEDFYRRALCSFEEENRHHPVKWFIFNAEASVEVDITGVDALEKLIRELQNRDVVFVFARVKKDLEVFLDKAGVKELVGEENFFPTLPTAVEAYKATS